MCIQHLYCLLSGFSQLNIMPGCIPYFEATYFQAGCTEQDQNKLHNVCVQEQLLYHKNVCNVIVNS